MAKDREKSNESVTLSKVITFTAMNNKKLTKLRKLGRL